MKTKLPVFAVALIFASWSGVSSAVDFDVHNPENGYASDRDYISDPQAASLQTRFPVLPGEGFDARLERAEIAAMEISEISTPTVIPYVSGWDPSLSEPLY